MLCLTRHKNEAIIITAGDQTIRILVLDWCKKKHRVRLGFDADKSVTIHREEVQRKVDDESQHKEEVAQ